jgi:hypothetical protein
MADKKKKKKEKVKYIDDGRTLYDMSGTSRTSVFLGGKNDGKNKKTRSTRREEFNTFVTTMRQMVLPMFIVMGIITVAFGILYLLLKFGV